jgi:hypothetical protein
VPANTVCPFVNDINGGKKCPFATKNCIDTERDKPLSCGIARLEEMIRESEHNRMVFEAKKIGDFDPI